MQIIYKNVNDIKPYPNNPRNNDNAVDAVAASIEEFGFKQPIIIDANNEIIAGHTRLKAAKKLGYEDVPCILADDLTPEQVKAYRLADNKVAELAGWNFEMLDSELVNIDDIDMEPFGFDMSFFNNSLNVSDDDFIKDTEITKDKSKTVKCPCCGEEFEI